MDQLEKYEFGEIFPGCRLLDIHEYLLEKGVKLDGVDGVRYMYHDPCHTPMKTYAPLAVVNGLMGGPVTPSERCCGESGMLATSRPDIATQVRFRKEGELARGAEALRADGFGGEIKVLTSCPSCLQGLSRFDGDAATTRGLHRGRDRAATPRSRLDGRVRRQRQPRRHRAGAGLGDAGRDGFASGCRRRAHRARRRRLCYKAPTEPCRAPGGGEPKANDDDRLRVLRRRRRPAAVARCALPRGPDRRAVPGFCRVIWNAHVREMTDLPAANRAHLMHVVYAVESALRARLTPTKMNLASLGNVVAAPALARDSALRGRHPFSAAGLGAAAAGGRAARASGGFRARRSPAISPRCWARRRRNDARCRQMSELESLRRARRRSGCAPGAARCARSSSATPTAPNSGRTGCRSPTSRWSARRCRASSRRSRRPRFPRASGRRSRKCCATSSPICTRNSRAGTRARRSRRSIANSRRPSTRSRSGTGCGSSTRRA